MKAEKADDERICVLSPVSGARVKVKDSPASVLYSKKLMFVLA